MPAGIRRLIWRKPSGSVVPACSTTSRISPSHARMLARSELSGRPATQQTACGLVISSRFHVAPSHISRMVSALTSSGMSTAIRCTAPKLVSAKRSRTSCHPAVNPGGRRKFASHVSPCCLVYNAGIPNGPISRRSNSRMTDALPVRNQQATYSSFVVAKLTPNVLLFSAAISSGASAFGVSGSGSTAGGRRGRRAIR